VLPDIGGAAVNNAAAVVAKVEVRKPAVVTRVILLLAYVAYDRGAGERPERAVDGVPHMDEKVVGLVTQSLPPKPVAGVVKVPTQVARVTSVQEEEPGVLPVPLAQAAQAADVAAVAPPSENVLEPHGITPVPAGTPEAPPGVPEAPASQK